MSYSKAVLDHYENPRNVGSFDKNDPNVGTGMVGAPACFAGATLIATPDSKNISLAVAYANDIDIHVWSYNLSTCKYEIKMARPVYSGKKELHKILVDGEEVWVTPDHKFLMVSGNYISNSELNPEDSVMPFHRTISSRGYWNVKSCTHRAEHLAYYKTVNNVTENLVHKFNIDHIDGDKRNNNIENLNRLTISDHISKSRPSLSGKINKHRSAELSRQIPRQSIIDLIEDDLVLYEIANKLEIYSDELYRLAALYAITEITNKTVINDELVKFNLSERMKKDNPYNNFTDKQKLEFATHIGSDNGRWIEVNNNDLLKEGSNLLYQHGKLTAKIWCKNAKSKSLPQNLSPRFNTFSEFKTKVSAYNHRVVQTNDIKIIDCYTLQVEENNNYVVITDVTKNHHSGIVVKNCGDVMKLQIKVEDGVITDAKFKTYGCFVSNTLVNTPTHTRKISELAVGDEVLSWDGAEVRPNVINEIITRSVPIEELVVVTLQRETSRKGINPRTFQLICTQEHVFWNANNKPILAKDLVAGLELYEITEYELRKLTNNRHRDDIKQKNAARMREFNKSFDHRVLPQNQPGYVCKDLKLKKQRSSTASKKMWQDPVYVKKWKQGMANIDRTSVTKLEEKYIKLFEDNNVAARYSAGKIWLQTANGPVSPDFIVPGKKKCIEVYTKRMPKFMQDRSDSSDYIGNRSTQLKTAGYDTLFLAVEDFDNSLEQVQNFIHNGMKVVSVDNITHKNQLRGSERSGNNVTVYDLKLEEGSHVYFTGRVGSHNCGSAIASSSLVTEMLKGKTVEQAQAIKNMDIVEELALPPVKIHCSVLAEDSIAAAIIDYNNKQEKLTQSK